MQINKKTYPELLKDPRWQKKRLEVFQRDNFCCLMCGSGEDTLHVHHEKYCKNPWDVDSKHLQTLCYICHEVAELAKKEHVKYTNVNRALMSDRKTYLYALSHRPNGYQCVTLFHNGYGAFTRLEMDFTQNGINLLINTL